MHDFKVLQTSEVKSSLEAAISQLTTNSPPHALSQLMTTSPTNGDKQRWHSSDIMRLGRYIKCLQIFLFL